MMLGKAKVHFKALTPPRHSYPMVHTGGGDMVLTSSEVMKMAEATVAVR